MLNTDNFKAKEPTLQKGITERSRIGERERFKRDKKCAVVLGIRLAGEKQMEELREEAKKS